MIHPVAIDDDAEFALIARGHYGDADASVTLVHKSGREEKRRAETLFLIASILEWCKGQGVVIDGAKVRYAG